MKKLLFLIALLPVAASAEEYDVKAVDDIAETQLAKLVRAHSVNEDGTYKYGHKSVRYIDGNKPAVQIAEYVTMPKKPVFVEYK